MKCSDAFWNAAQEIQDDQVACHQAICYVVDDVPPYAYGEWHFFSDLFKPDWHSFWWWSDSLDESNDEARRIALLLAHYIALDMERETYVER